MLKRVMTKPKKEGCFRVEYKPGQWAWLLVMNTSVGFMFKSDKDIPHTDSLSADWDVGYVSAIKRGLKYIEVKPPRGTK